MKIFEVNEKILISIGLCVQEKAHNSFRRNLQYNCLLIFFLLEFLWVSYASALYIMEYYPNFIEYNFAMVSFVGGVVFIFSILSIFLQKGKVRIVIDKLRGIIDKSERFR